MAGLYIHFPFCIKKCPYCSFVSFDSRYKDIPIYFECLKREIQLLKRKGLWDKKRFQTIYLGGGTPSLFPVNFLDELLSLLGNSFNISKDPEITIECNPDSVSMKKLKRWRQMGINRISIGLQDLTKKGLAFLGRIHSVEQGEKSVKMVQDVGFTNFSVDIIYGLPEQDEKWLFRTLKRLIALSPPHVSAYELTIEENTPFWQLHKKGSFKELGQEKSLKLTRLVEAFLKDNGIIQYEISNFSKPGYECIHNIGYWKCQSYLGIGLSAVSFLDNKRVFNLKDMDAYFKAILSQRLPVESKEILDKNLRFKETFIMGLRMNRGIDINEFKKRFGIDLFKFYGKELERFKKLKLLDIDEKKGRINLTNRGRYISNYILSCFL